MFGGAPNRQFSSQDGGSQQAYPVAGRRHSNVMHRRPVNATPAQPQLPQNQSQRQRNLSLPGPETREQSNPPMDNPSFPPTPIRTPTTLSNSSHNEPSESPLATTATSPVYVPNPLLDTRLADLASRTGITKRAIDTTLQQPSRPSFSTPETVVAVRENLISIRRAQPDYKPPSSSGAGFLRKKTQVSSKDEAQTATFKFKELSYALDQEILRSGLEAPSDLECAANVEVLLNLGADVNIYRHAKDSLVSKMHIGKSEANSELSARYIQNAAERGKANVVWVLASRGVKQAGLNEAYQIAMKNNDSEVIRILLEHGADPNADLEAFERVVLSGEVDIANLILRSSIPITKDYLSRPLKSTIEMAYVDMAELLVAYGADLEYNNAEALIGTTQIGRWDILLRMILNKSVPSGEISPFYLSTAFENATQLHQDPALRLILVEILLCAGARGIAVANLLMDAVMNDDTNLISLLLEFDVDVNLGGAQALKYAVSTCQIHLVQILLGKPPSPENLNLAFAEIPFASQSEEVINSLASLLLAAGTSGESVARLLVQAVRAGYNDTLKLLIIYNASIEYNNCEALVHAITSVDIRKVKALLNTSISPQYATIAFSAIDLFLEETVLHELMSLFLSRGAHGDPVDAALVTAVKKKQWPIITLLRSHNANVEYGNATVLVHAVGQSDEAMLDILLQNPVSANSANIAFGILKMDTKELYPMAKRLIEVGAHGTPLSKLLIDAVEKQNFTIADLLLKHGASVSYNDGASLQKAVETGDDQLVKLLVAKCTGTHAKETMRKAFPLTHKLAGSSRSSVIALFLEHGLRGPIITEALIGEIKKTPVHYSIVEMLLRKGEADLGASNGDALKIAVERGDSRLLGILLSANPDLEIISAAIPSAMEVKSDTVRFSIVEMLLAAGAQGDEVSVALLKTVKKQPEALGQIDLLLDNGADVNFNHGEILKVAFVSKHIDVFRRLLSREVSKPNLASVFRLALEHNDPVWQYKTAELIIQRGLAGPIVDDALIELAQQENEDARVLSLLLDHGASVNHASGEAILHCVRQGSAAKLQMLLSPGPEKSVIKEALQAAMELSNMDTKRAMVNIILTSEPDQEDIDEALVRALEDDEPSKRLVAALLDSEASILHDDGKVIKLAALGSHHHVLEMLLLKYPHLSSELSMIFTATFDDAMNSGVWRTEDGLLTMQVLLAHGAGGIAIDKAFATASETYERFPTAKRLIESLLQSPNANINREDGLCLQIAAGKANAELVELLLTGNPSKRSLSMAFPHLISSGTDESNLLEIAKLFLAPGLDTDLKFQHPSFGPVLFGALTKYPNFLEFYEILLQGGADLESDVKINFHSVGEKVTPLLWTILQLPDVIETKIIKFFIDSGANVNFKSEYSGTSPLMVAVQRKRRDVVFELLKAGASVTMEDRQGQTALLKACQEGVYDIVELLLARDKCRNDGSLHAAAAFCHPDIISLLIREGKHDPDFPSSRHQGRSALAELAYVGDATDNPERLKSTVENLLDNGADPSLRTNNKSALIFGLDNQNPVAMTRLLLNAGLYKTINNSFNLYQDDKKAIYSPTMYVQKGLCSNRSPEVQEELYQLLKSFRGEDRFFIDDPHIPQPLGYTGIPIYLAKIEEERQVMQRKIDHEKYLQQARLRMEKEESAERERIRNLEYQAELVRQADRKAREDARIAKQRAEELAFIRSMNEQKQIAQDLEMSRQIAHSQRIHEEEQEHKSTLNQQELKMIEFKLAAERKRQQEIEDASNREHTRQLEYLKQWKGNLESQRQLTDRAGVGPSQRQLMWPYTKDDIPD